MVIHNKYPVSSIVKILVTKKYNENNSCRSGRLSKGGRLF